MAFVLFRSTAVPVAPPDAGAAQVASCRTLQTLLPGTVDGLARRSVEPSSDLTAAWGEPAVTLRCGVGRPKALLLTSELFAVNGVSWFAEAEGAGWRFTATGRSVYVEVDVPSGSEQQASAPLVDLATPITSALPLTQQH